MFNRMEKQLLILLQKKFQSRNSGFGDDYLIRIIRDIQRYDPPLRARVYTVINTLDDYKWDMDPMEQLQYAVYTAKVEEFRTSEDGILSYAWELGGSDEKLIKPPTFEYQMRNGEIAELHRTEKHICFVPAGYDGKLPGGIVPMQQRIAGPKALMSLLHVLVVPMVRIYNAARLPDDYDFDDARACGKAGIEKLLNGDKYFPGSWDWWMTNETVNGLGLRPKATDMAYDKPIEKPQRLDLECTFHVTPDNSIGFLHMHVFEKSLLTKNYETMSPLINTPVYLIENTAFELDVNEDMFEDEEVVDLEIRKVDDPMEKGDLGMDILIADFEREDGIKVDEQFMEDIDELMKGDLKEDLDIGEWMEDLTESESDDSELDDDKDYGPPIPLLPLGSVWEQKSRPTLKVTLIKVLPGKVRVRNGGNLEYEMTDKQLLSLYRRIK